jgi:HEPN domain-containing protein
MKAPEKESARWFLQAEDDLRFVEWLWKEGIFFDKGCFMSQQAGEKALKACLYADIAKVEDAVGPRLLG